MKPASLFSWGGLFTFSMALGLFSPLENFPWLACVLFTPLAYKLRHENRILNGLFIGWIFGTLSWAAGTWWVVKGMTTLLDWSWGHALAGAALIWLIQGVPFALFGGICGWMNQKGYRPGPLFCASLLTLLVCFLRPPLFPISSVVSVALWPPFIQIADLGGEDFVFFVLILVNWLGAEVFACFKHYEPGPFWIRASALTVLLTAVLGYGVFRINQLDKLARTQEIQIKVALVQPNVPVLRKTPGDFVSDEGLCLLTLKAHADKIKTPGLIIFPEMPGFDCQSDSFKDTGLKKAIQTMGIPALVHSDEYILAPEPPAIQTTCDRMVVKQKIDKKFSSVFFMPPGDEPARVYRKVKLVPFSATTPFTTGFPWFRHAQEESLEFSMGDNPGLIKIGNLAVQPLICFETGFPNLIRNSFVSRRDVQGPDLLIEVSNDGWFFSRDAEMKHLGMGIFRSVEFRRPLVRSSNSGSSAHITATGSILPGTLTPHGKTDITQALMHCPESLTLFSQWGNTWLWGALFIVLGRMGVILAQPGSGQD